MALINRGECVNMVIEYSSKLYEKKHKSGFTKYLPYVLGVMVVLGIAGYFLSKNSLNGFPSGGDSTTTIAANSLTTDGDSVNQSLKDEITKSLQQLFDEVMSEDCPEYDERYFSSDFNSIYNEVDEIDKRFEGEIGFWDSGFWDNSQDCDKLIIILDDIYGFKEDEAIAQVTFQTGIGEYIETMDEEIKVIRENGKWVLDDIHSYKQQMKEYVKETKDYHPSEVKSMSDDGQ